MKIPLVPGTARMKRIEAQVSARLQREFAAPTSWRPTGVSARDRNAARMFWSQRAWSEYAAIPALAQILVKGVAARVPVDESAALAGIVHDEALHTQLSQDAADGFGGYLEDVPPDLAFDPYALAHASPRSMLGDLVTGCLLGETISRALIQARLPHTRPAPLRAIVTRTLKDESVHVAFAWAVAERVLPTLSRSDLRDVAELVTPAWRASRQRTAGRGKSARARAKQDAMKDRVCAAGLGSCTAVEERAVVDALFTSTIVPKLRALGVPLA